MTTPGYGYTPKDHRRVSNSTVWVERNKARLLQESASQQRPRDRGLVRLIAGANAPGEAAPTIVYVTQGDLTIDAMAFNAIITRPIPWPGAWSQSANPGFDYFVRCADQGRGDGSQDSEQGSGARTWQLSVIPPNYLIPGTVTSPISEYATASDVESAINATGCPPCTVSGLGKYCIDPTGQYLPWPQRVWHIHWPQQGWILTTMRSVPGSPPGFAYVPGTGEVPVQLIVTAYRPTEFCELVFPQFQMRSQLIIPGQIIVAEAMTGLGLAIVNQECWSYND